MNKRGISYVSMIVLVTVVATTGMILIKNLPNEKNKNKFIETRAYINTEKLQNKIDDREFKNHLINEVEKYVSMNIIEKEDGTSLTLAKFNLEKNQYINNLFSVSFNKDVVKYVYEKNNKTYVVYNVENFLKILGLKTVENSSFGTIDSNGCKLYCVEEKGWKNEKAQISEEDNALISSFGYNTDKLIGAIMNQIEYSVSQNSIYNIENGNIMTQKEYRLIQDTMRRFLEVVLGNKNYIPEIKFIDIGLEVKFDLKKILNSWGYDINETIGIDSYGVGRYVYL